ncbi:hypothetical protein [Lactococcus petauri]|uniref:hypothetical protein n=1 Tax=Lactococcus petauri TaxID=1940789 RepID=UPI00117BD719|nr:hypothetical protein [Lactococcus petauri]
MSTTPIKAAITCIEPVKGIQISKEIIATANVTLLLNLSLISVYHLSFLNIDLKIKVTGEVGGLLRKLVR